LWDQHKRIFAIVATTFGFLASCFALRWFCKAKPTTVNPPPTEDQKNYDKIVNEALARGDKKIKLPNGMQMTILWPEGPHGKPLGDFLKDKGEKKIKLPNGLTVDVEYVEDRLKKVMIEDTTKGLDLEKLILLGQNIKSEDIKK
jgi:hypothetical protein